MTVTLDLPPDVERVYLAAASRRGIPLQAFMTEFLASHQPEVAPTATARLTGAALVAAMQGSPHKDVSLDVECYPMPVRDVSF